MTVCFCGHSKLYNSYDSIKAKCFEIVQEQIVKGADSFLVGDYGDFDSLAASICLGLKKVHPYIEVNLVIPYYRPHIDDYIQKRYNRFDCVITPPLENTPYRYRIIKANQYMVDQAETVIAYVRSSGGAAQTMQYALKTKKNIINLGDKFKYKENEIWL